MRCYFVSDLHGSPARYEALFSRLVDDPPDVLLLGGDLLPHGLGPSAEPGGGFVRGFLADGFGGVARRLGTAYPRVLAILGNDDLRIHEPAMLELAEAGLWDYLHQACVGLEDLAFCGYACVPPTPFQLKDWERYDVSRFVDPGSVSPEEGCRSVPAPEADVRYGTIQRDLQRLTEGRDLSATVLLFHAPPYRTALDRAALDGKMVDHVPLDIHVGSVAIRRFIEARQPLVTLHGHIHESARLTGSWRDRIGRTHMMSAAHDGPELALVRFDTDAPEAAERDLL